MSQNRPLTIVAKTFIVLVIGAVTLLALRPELLELPRPVVQIQEAPRAADLHDTGVQATRIHELRDSYAGGVETASPAVVNIHTARDSETELRGFFRGPPGEQGNLGSGVIISPEGYILTNNHVIEGSETISVALRDGRQGAARVIGTDPETDLAVLKVDLGELPYVRLGDSEDLRVGDVVLAIGNPFGVGQTVTLGIVSATGRSRLGLNTFENFIQTDAAINPGNSGGALVNPDGDLIGINTAIYSRTGGSQGIGFAIPVSIVRDVMSQIIEDGQVTRGWLGVEIQAMTRELAESFGAPDDDGVLVAGVLQDGPAAAAGLEPGDIIRRLADESVNDVETLLDQVAQRAPGETLPVTVMRNGARETFDVEIGRRPTPEGS